jgi:hypothetical protein
MTGGHQGPRIPGVERPSGAACCPGSCPKRVAGQYPLERAALLEGEEAAGPDAEEATELRRKLTRLTDMAVDGLIPKGEFKTR